MQFDVSVSQEANQQNENFDLYQADCWNSSLSLRIENALSIDYFNEAYAEREQQNASSYGGSDAGSWLLSLGQSLLLSLFLWQPLTYVIISRRFTRGHVVRTSKTLFLYFALSFELKYYKGYMW